MGARDHNKGGLLRRLWIAYEYIVLCVLQFWGSTPAAGEGGDFTQHALPDPRDFTEMFLPDPRDFTLFSR